MVNLYRIFGAVVIGGCLLAMGTGWAGGGSRDQIPSDSLNKGPGAYRSYFILYGGK